MALNYSIMMLGNPFKPEEPKKAYAKAQTNGELTLREISEQVSNKSTVHRADVSAVLIATVESMLEGLKEGKQVDFGELGKFRIQLNSEGAKDAESFTSANINGANIQFVPGPDLQNIFSKLNFKLVATRAAQAAVLKAQKAGETIVDISQPQTDPSPTDPQHPETEPGGGGSHTEPGSGDHTDTGGGSGSGDMENPLG